MNGDRFKVVMHGDSEGSGSTYRQVAWYEVVDTELDYTYRTRFSDIGSARDYAHRLEHGV